MALPGPAIDLVLRHEGGLVNDPQDPGGLTNFGLSKKSYPDLDISNLTRAQAGSIYQRDFWTATMAAQTDQRLANCMLDCRVNQGPAVEGRIYQKGVSLIDFQIARLLRYVSIVAQNPAELKFLGGWFRRTLDC
jgi:lysozyme family protein